MIRALWCLLGQHAWSPLGGWFINDEPLTVLRECRRCGLITRADR